VIFCIHPVQAALPNWADCWIVERPRRRCPDAGQRHQRVYARLRGEAFYATSGASCRGAPTSVWN